MRRSWSGNGSGNGNGNGNGSWKSANERICVRGRFSCKENERLTDSGIEIWKRRGNRLPRAHRQWASYSTRETALESIAHNQALIRIL